MSIIPHKPIVLKPILYRFMNHSHKINTHKKWVLHWLMIMDFKFVTHFLLVMGHESKLTALNTLDLKSIYRYEF